MKLIGLYIENFGGLQKYSLNFETGITSVISPMGLVKLPLQNLSERCFMDSPARVKRWKRACARNIHLGAVGNSAEI